MKASTMWWPLMGLVGFSVLMCSGVEGVGAYGESNQAYATFAIVAALLAGSLLVFIGKANGGK